MSDMTKVGSHPTETTNIAVGGKRPIKNIAVGGKTGNVQDPPDVAGNGCRTQPVVKDVYVAVDGCKDGCRSNPRPWQNRSVVASGYTDYVAEVIQHRSGEHLGRRDPATIIQGEVTEPTIRDGYVSLDLLDSPRLASTESSITGTGDGNDWPEVSVATGV